jgi:hypothetical protein
MAGRQGVVVGFLVLAAHFESSVHPFVIMLSVLLAIAGALMGLWFSGLSMNIYSEIGLVMRAGLAAKNGILIVENRPDRTRSGQFGSQGADPSADCPSCTTICVPRTGAADFITRSRAHSTWVALRSLMFGALPVYQSPGTEVWPP